MTVDVTPAGVSAGMSNEPIGTHIAKTMMVRELRDLLSAVPERASLADYKVAAVEHNALRKGTAQTRAKTFTNLRHLYALHPHVPVFAALRALWTRDADAQPRLALLCANARDPLLRATADFVLSLAIGAPITPSMFVTPVREAFPDRYSSRTLVFIGQHVSSSWHQAGFFAGTRPRIRERPQPRETALVYALYLGHLEGVSGPALFGTRWARLLEADEHWMTESTENAARAGWIDYAKSGGMLAIGFSHLDELTNGAAA